jgi:hypothetical protein
MASVCFSFFNLFKGNVMKQWRGMIGLLVFALALALGAEEGAAAPPSKLSDLHKFLMRNVQSAFGSAIKGRPVIQGLSNDIIKTGRFRKVELDLQPFRFQELNIERCELVFEHFWIKPQALQQWQVEVEKVGDATSRLVFTMQSLEKKLGPLGEVKIKPEIATQQLEMLGKGRFFFIPMEYSARAKLHWDGKKLMLKPQQLSWGGMRVPLWLGWLGSPVFSQAPVLDLSNNWIPFNIQEVHLSWDTVTLSTNW